MTIVNKAPLVLLFVAVVSFLVKPCFSNGVRGGNPLSETFRLNDTFTAADEWNRHLSSSRSISCTNTVDRMRIVDDDEWKWVGCGTEPQNDINCLQFDGASRKPIWAVCPLMCPFTGCHDDAPESPPLFEEPFEFKCENRVSSVRVIGENDEVIDVVCEDSPNNGDNDNFYCKQFDQISKKLVYQVCPMFCSYMAYTVCDDGCTNKVDEVVVLGNKDNEEVRTVDCQDSPGKNSRYCNQFNHRTKNLVWRDCPLMCPTKSLCN